MSVINEGNKKEREKLNRFLHRIYRIRWIRKR